MEFANSTQFQFEPGASEAVDLSAAAEAYNTPDHLRPRLGDLANLSYVRGRWAVDLVADAASAAVVTVALMAGATTVQSVDLDFAGAARVGDVLDVDLGAIPGGTPLTVRITVTTEEAARTAVLRSWLAVEHPVVISNC